MVVRIGKQLRLSRPVEAESKLADRPARDDFAHLVAQFESEVKRLKSVLIRDFGSIENVLKIPRKREALEKGSNPFKEPLLGLLDFLAHCAHSIAHHLADVEWWEKLAESDLKGYRRRQEALLRAYKLALDAVCGIEGHRPANQQRNSIVLDIKQSRPNLSFGQVAREYTRKTGKPMTAKQAERIFKRGNTQPDPLHLLRSFKNALRALKQLRPFVEVHLDM